VELATGVVDGELPGDSGALLVARGLPGGDLGGLRVAVADAPALTVGNASARTRQARTRTSFISGRWMVHNRCGKAATTARQLEPPPSRSTPKRRTSLRLARTAQDGFYLLIGEACPMNGSKGGL
jgi:hypothetical protein